MERKEILKEVKSKLKEIEKLNKEIRNLRIKAYQLNDDKSTYKEDFETHGVGKNKKTDLFGRMYFTQKFKDESTGKYFKVERNKIVRINKVWLI